MTEIIDFFISPYKSAPAIDILLEIIAAALGIASVLYAKKENVLVFPTGIISTSIYIYLLSQWNLFGDLIINIYYTLMSLYGWYAWMYLKNKNNEQLNISKTTVKQKWLGFCIFIFAAGFVISLYRYFEVVPKLNIKETLAFIYDKLSSGDLDNFREAIPFLDSLTTASAFVAMWLMAIKKIEHWVFWIITNIFSIPLYFIKGFGFTGIQYTVFLILAYLGYKAWKNHLNKKSLLV